MKKLTEKQKRIKAAVVSLREYMANYDGQPGYLDYEDKTFIDDVLYGLGVALDAEYTYAQGFDLFKQKLREHLGAK